MHNVPTAEVMKVRTGETQNIAKTVNIDNKFTPKMNILSHAIAMVDAVNTKPVKTHLDIDKHDSKAVEYAKVIVKDNRVMQPLIYLTIIEKLLDERSDVQAKFFEMIDLSSDVIYNHDNGKTTGVDNDIKTLKVVREEACDLFPGQFDE